MRNWLSRKGGASSDNATKKSGRPWWHWALGAVLGLYALYVGAATAFISLGGVTWLTQSEEDVSMEVRGGYSLFPGRMHLTGLMFQFKDYNIEMALSADEADLSMALYRLPSKKIHIHWVRASGAEFKMLHRVKDAKKSAARLAAFPDIAAFDRPAYYDKPRPPRSGKKPWSLRVDSIEAEARLAWIMEYQLRGKIRAKGAFYTDPLSKAEVLPCTTQLAEGTISVGQTQIAHEVQGSLGFSLSPFTARDAPIAEVIPKISARIGDFSATLDNLTFSELYVSTDRIRLNGQGQLEIDTTLTDGQVQAGSSAKLALSSLTVAAQGEGKHEGTKSAQGRGQLSLQAEPGGHMNIATSVLVPSQEGAAFSVKESKARVALHHNDVTEFDIRGAEIDVDTLHFDRPDFLYALFGHHAAIPMSGTFHARAKADLPEQGTAQLDAHLEMLSTSFYFEGQRAGATAETELSCKGKLSDARCEFDFHAPSVRFDKEADDEEAVVLWLRLKTQEKMQVNAERGTFVGGFVISGGDPKDLVSEMMGEAWLPQMGLKLVPTGTINGSFNARRSESAITLSNIDIATGNTQLEGELTSGETTTALGTIKMPTGRWGFEKTPDDLRIRPLIGKNWAEKQ